MDDFPAFPQFALLPTEVRLTIWDYAAPIPYDHRLIVLIDHEARYITAREAAKDAKAIKARPATQNRKAVERRPAQETHGAHIEFPGQIRSCSWPLSNLLAVNTEACTRVLRANPNFIQVGEGPRVYFDAKKNLIHFDLQAMYHLALIHSREGGERGTSRNKLVGFDTIVNISMPNYIAPNTMLLLRWLRGPALKPPNWNASPLLAGVTYCESAVVPGTYNKTWPVYDKMMQELAMLRQQYNDNKAQQGVIIEETNQILADITYLSLPVSWEGTAALPPAAIGIPGKPQGVRVLENAL